MDFINKKIFLTKYLVPYDSNNDGVTDSLILSAITKHIQIPLFTKMDDIGIYESVSEKDQDELEIIDIGNLWDETNTGSGDGGVDVNPNIGIDWGDGGYPGGTNTSGEVINACIDEYANNFNINYFNLNELYNNSNGVLGVKVNNVGCTYSSGGQSGGASGTGTQEGGLTNEVVVVGNNNNSNCRQQVNLAEQGQIFPDWYYDKCKVLGNEWTDIPPSDILNSSYYQFWLSTANQVCIQRGFVRLMVDDDFNPYNPNYVSLTQGPGCTVYDGDYTMPFANLKVRQYTSCTCCPEDNIVREYGNYGNWVCAEFVLRYSYEFCGWCTNLPEPTITPPPIVDLDS